MGIRKNAKYLSATEIEDFVRACVLMKADIVNPAAPAAQQYGRWDEYVAVHRMIQNANSPGNSGVNFGHGGAGAFSFFSWHRYFLLRLEQQLQTYVPGVMLPYWDWTDPAPLLTDAFLGPDGDSGTEIVSSGYFAANAPGTPGNPTPAPAWWPASLTGWRLHAAFTPFWDGPLRRDVGGALPSLTDLQEALGMGTYASFQDALESGTGLTSSHQMHNGLHGYIGGHMSDPTASPFDPIFYMHHCNIDRYWAMWQMDGQATTYPVAGGNAEHHRNDIMYPWTGGAAGYSTNVSLAPIVMPDLSAVGAQTNGDTLDHRALGYTYDTLPVLAVSLDRSGSMTQMTPDPMTSAEPNVTKWEAATRGVSALLHDCEAAYAAKEAYVYAGVETFRSSGSNQFDAVFGATASNLIKAGGSHNASVFDGAIAGLSPGGGTPLADALTHADSTLVKGPFANLPVGEQRYLAILTDGNRTSGSTIGSVSAGALGDTAVFAMGFGTGAEVSYTTLDQLVTKGKNLGIPQVFHGENAGTIDKFFTNSLAEAIGYTPMVDPFFELFAGEHAHVDFYATSAEDSFFISAQGMDFDDDHWRYHLVAPNGQVVYGHQHHGHGASHDIGVSVSVKRRNGRLSLFLKRDGAACNAWVGKWQLMIAYKAHNMSMMVMLPVGALLAPVSAGPVRGPRYFRPRTEKGGRPAARLISAVNSHGLDLMPPFTSGAKDDASNVLVNIYARTRLKINLNAAATSGLKFNIDSSVSHGNIDNLDAFGRLFLPQVDIKKLLSKRLPSDLTKGALLRKCRSRKYDPTVILSRLEQKNRKLFEHEERVIKFRRGKKGSAHASVRKVNVQGAHHIGVMVSGNYTPTERDSVESDCCHATHASDLKPQRFERVLTHTIAAKRR